MVQIGKFYKVSVNYQRAAVHAALPELLPPKGLRVLAAPSPNPSGNPLRAIKQFLCHPFFKASERIRRSRCRLFRSGLPGKLKFCLECPFPKPQASRV